MNILATVEYHGWFWFILISLSVITLLFIGLVVIGIVSIIREGIDFNSIAALFICALLSTLFGFGTLSAYIDGVQVEYKATVTDFNEVFNKGYEIVKKEGEIYTLTKVE